MSAATAVETHALARGDKQFKRRLDSDLVLAYSAVLLSSRQLYKTRRCTRARTQLETLYNILVTHCPSVFNCTLQMINGRMRAKVVKASMVSEIICYQACRSRVLFIKTSETPPKISRLLFRVFTVIERWRNRNKSETGREMEREREMERKRKKRALGTKSAQWRRTYRRLTNNSLSDRTDGLLPVSSDNSGFMPMDLTDHDGVSRNWRNSG